VTKQWYDEEPTYDYSGRSNAGSAGEFLLVMLIGLFCKIVLIKQQIVNKLPIVNEPQTGRPLSTLRLYSLIKNLS